MCQNTAGRWCFSPYITHRGIPFEHSKSSLCPNSCCDNAMREHHGWITTRRKCDACPHSETRAISKAHHWHLLYTFPQKYLNRKRFLICIESQYSKNGITNMWNLSISKKILTLGHYMPPDKALSKHDLTTSHSFFIAGNEINWVFHEYFEYNRILYLLIPPYNHKTCLRQSKDNIASATALKKPATIQYTLHVIIIKDEDYLNTFYFKNAV